MERLTAHYENKGFDAAIDALAAAISAVSLLINATPSSGTPHLRPYPDLKVPGLLWIKEVHYWVAYLSDPSPIIVAVFHETANIPGLFAAYGLHTPNMMGGK